MGQPVFLVRNLFSKRIYPLHTLAASASAGAGEISGNEFARIGTGCRDPQDFWTNETANTQVIGLVTCDRIRSADMFVLDRGHNLAGKQVVLECSNDNFSTDVQVCFDCVLPAVTLAGAISDMLGVRTEEGAWIKRFLVRAAKYWRLRIPAMGASLRPQIVNVWLDLSWSPTFLGTPLAPDEHELGGTEGTTKQGWRIVSDVWVRRQGEVEMLLPTSFEYDLARDHIQFQFGLNRPMWIVHDEEQGDRAALAVPKLGTVRVELRGRGWFYPKVQFQWIEHEPREAA